jgi:hypothetical protein
MCRRSALERRAGNETAAAAATERASIHLSFQLESQCAAPTIVPLNMTEG